VEKFRLRFLRLQVYPYGVVVEPIIGKIIDVHNKWEMLGMKKFLISLVVVLAAVVGGSAVTPGTTAQAAKTKFTHLKATPKKMRGTWYHKDAKRGMFKIVIKKHSFNYKYDDQNSLIKKLDVTKDYQKGKLALYGFDSKTAPSGGTVLFNYTKKINGKKRHVLVELPQGAGINPNVFTKTKPKRTYTVSQKVLNKRPDSITQ